MRLLSRLPESGVGIERDPFATNAFLWSAGIVSISSAAALLRGVVLAKVYAVVLGPSGLGILAQLLNFSSLAATIAALGLTLGVTKMVADSDRQSTTKPSVDIVVGSSIVVSIVASSAAVLLLLPFSVDLSVVLTGRTGYSDLIVLTIVAIPLTNTWSVLAYALQGLGDIRRFTWASVLGSLLTVMIAVPSVYKWGLRGAVIAALVGAAVQLLVFLWALDRGYAARKWPRLQWRVSSPIAKQLALYGGVVMLGGAGSWASVFIVRTLTIHTLGDAPNGLYQVAYALSSQYITVFMAWMTAYVFPRISISAAAVLAQRLNSTLELNLILMLPVLLAVIGFRSQLVALLFAQTFAAAAPLVALQSFGDYARVVGWSYGVSLFARGKVGSHVVSVLSQSAAWVLLAIFLVPRFGVTGLAISYSISFVTWPILMIALSRHWFEVRPSSSNVIFIFGGLLALLATALTPLGMPLGAAVVAAIAVRRAYETKGAGSYAPADNLPK